MEGSDRAPDSSPAHEREAERRSLENHLTLLGVLHVVYHSLGLLAGLVIFGVLSTAGVLSGDSEAARILGIIGSIIAWLFVILTAPGIITGIGILKRQAWARILGFIVGALGLLDIPFGTALGVYTFWVLLKENVEDVLH